MAGGAGSLEQTPTWSVAVVCFVLVVISIAIEQIIHMVGKWLMKRHKVALVEALEKVKAELMLLGFISLLLTVLQNRIANICIPRNVGDSWHPCKNLAHDPPPAPAAPSDDLTAGKSRRRLLLLEQLQMLTAVGETDYHHDPSMRRFLAGKSDDKCAAKGMVPLISTNGIHELHIFIFVLAIMHILYCIITLAFGRLKMRKWKAWERETKTAEYQFSHDPERFRFTRDTSFGRRHLDFWSKSPILIWIVCFFRQFVRSVPKVDYLTLRHGFITAHLAPSSSSKFDFQKYISRSLEKDFKVVVGISPLIWLFAVLFLLFNTHGWYSYLWLPFIPLIIILMVGTKLQVIITRMAVQIMERGDVIKGVPVVKPADRHFWFNNPKLMLHLIHFVLFENAFQLAFFVFSTYKYGINSCFHKETADFVIRITMGIIIQILCSYVTLPLYALVTQMGSNMKSTIFNERVEVALRKWHQTARRHVKESRKSGTVTPMSTSRPATPTHRLSPGQQTPAGRLSPVHLLHRYQGEMDSYQASPVQTPTHGMSPVHLLRHYQSELDSVHASSLTRNYISDEDRLDIENSITSAYYRNFEGSSHNRGGTNDGSSHNRSSESSHHLRKEGGVQQGDDQDGEIQMTGKGDDQGHVAIDFSFDKRRLM